jgi:hypothetical protein
MEYSTSVGEGPLRRLEEALQHLGIRRSEAVIDVVSEWYRGGTTQALIRRE